MDPTPVRCPLCDLSTERTLLLRDGLYKFACRRCGTYFVDRCDYEDFLAPQNRLGVERSRMLSAVLREALILGRPPIFIQFAERLYEPFHGTIAENVEDLLRTNWPQAVPARVDRALCNLARISKNAGQTLGLLRNDSAVAFALSEEEAQQFQEYLRVEELIDVDKSGSHVTLTLKGWRRFQELTEGSSLIDNPAFVAMWFGEQSNKKKPTQKPQMDSLYREALEPAVKDAGFLCIRSNEEEHTDFVMDRVLGAIRRAPFVVADFTGNRNGVYFEAGFARALGRKVIHTCKSVDFKGAHFDIRQLNTIVWKEHDELRQRIFHRILQVVGPGRQPVNDEFYTQLKTRRP